MDSFTPIASTIGGALIGLSATLVLLFQGRVAGISGIFASALSREPASWRLSFLGGLLVGGAALATLAPELFAVTHGRSLPMIAIAGLIVGYGTRLGSGCTSGHGVCGVSRLSRRSIGATLVFIATGAATVYALRVGGLS